MAYLDALQVPESIRTAIPATSALLQLLGVHSDATPTNVAALLHHYSRNLRNTQLRPSLCKAYIACVRLLLSLCQATTEDVSRVFAEHCLSGRVPICIPDTRRVLRLPSECVIAKATHHWLLRKVDVSKLPVLHPLVDDAVAKELRVAPLPEVLSERVVGVGSTGAPLTRVQGREQSVVCATISD